MRKDNPPTTRTSDTRYIVIEGPIGAGKSTLAKMLSRELDARLVEEQPDENPFLGPFYQDPTRHALSVQLFFLLQRYQQQQDLAQLDLFSRGGVVADYLFAKDRLFAAMNLSPNELFLYDRVYQSLSPRTLVPDLVVYLQARTEVLVERINRRARSVERPIEVDYIRRVADMYTSYFFNYTASPLLIVNASDINVVENEEERQALINEIRATRSGVRHWGRAG